MKAIVETLLADDWIDPDIRKLMLADSTVEDNVQHAERPSTWEGQKVYLKNWQLLKNPIRDIIAWQEMRDFAVAHNLTPAEEDKE